MSLDTQFFTIITMIGGGMYLGAAIDTFRRFEYHWKKRMLSKYVNELFFWLLQGLLLFYLLFLVNQGELRFYILLATICGFAAYQALGKKVYLVFLEKVIQLTTALFRMFKKLILLLIINPIKWLLQFIMKVLLGIWTLLLWLLLILYKVILFPFRIFGTIIWWILPKNVKNYLRKLAGIYSKIKNIVSEWWKQIKEKRR